jgi:hypothetical protein
VLQCDQVIELHVTHLGQGGLELLLPLPGHTGEESQFAGDGGAVEVEEQGDAPQGDPGTQELEYLGISPAFVLSVWFLKGG